MTKYKVMAIHDVHFDTPKGRLLWAYARRTAALKRYAPPDFTVDTFKYAEVPWKRAGEYDLIYQTEYAAIGKNKLKGNRPNTDVPIVASYNSDSRRRLEYWRMAMRDSDWLVVNNKEMYDFKEHTPNTCCISNGVCTETFEHRVPIEDRPQKIFWRGSSGWRKGKGWKEVLEPAMKRLRELGFDPDFKTVDEINVEQCATTDEIVDLYNQSSYVVCTSASEGSPNFLLEAASLGCVPVSCNVGNLQEFKRPNENSVIIERTVESLIQGLLYAREHRERLSHSIRETMRNWSYGPPGNRAKVFFDLFRRIINGETVAPFSYQDFPPYA